MYASLVFICFQALLLNVSAIKKIIIDTDAGADDAVAIFLLLRATKDPEVVPPFEIVGITTSYGNTYENNAETNVLKILTIANRTDILVYGGSKRSITEKFESDNYFGTDGFGDAPFSYDLTAQVDRSKHAVNALIDLAKENSGNINVVALGPLTNLGLAISLDNDFPTYVNQFYVMGGSVRGYGKKSPNVEFNFGADPICNSIFFDSMVRQAQITLLPWETTTNVPVEKSWRKDVLGKRDSPIIKFLDSIEAKTLANNESNWDRPDAIAAATFIREDIINRNETIVNIQAVADGKARGSLLVDYYDTTKKLANTKIVTQVDLHWYKRILSRYLTCDELVCK